MIDKDIMYEAFELEAKELAAAYDLASIPDHKFSWRYNQKKRAMIKAYRKSLEKPIEFVVEYRRISLRQRIAIAVLVALTAAAATGAGLYVTHYIGGIMANQQSTHTDAFAMDWESAPKTLEKVYRITYNLDDYDKKVLSDNILKYWENYTKEDYYIKYMYFTKEAYQNARLNTEGTTIEVRTISGFEAIYFVANSDAHCLVWDNGEYVFEMIFNIDYETAKEIAESIKEIK
jgi:hypothetical protein